MVTPRSLFDFSQTQTRGQWMKVAVVLALGMSFLFSLMGRPLNTEAAPGGIISFEFAGSVEEAQVMMDSWGERGRLVAAISLGLDFLYALVYASAISLACLWAAARIRPFSPAMAGAGLWLAWGVWLAALLDYIENIALIQLLLGATAPVWPMLAFACATLKFLLVILGILYVLAAWLFYRTRK